MTTDDVAKVYKEHGFRYGEVEELGTGEPSESCRQLIGFAWPVGTIFVAGNNRYRVLANQTVCLDRQARG